MSGSTEEIVLKKIRKQKTKLHSRKNNTLRKSEMDGLGPGTNPNESIL